jgi:hypothetical protein
MPWKLRELVKMELRAWQDLQLATQRAQYLHLPTESAEADKIPL